MSPIFRVLAICLLLPTQGRGESRDSFGDPLPPPARCRLGTMRFRHGEGIRGVVFSANGRLLASLGRDKTIRLWETSTGKLLNQFEQVVLQAAFSPDGKMLAGATSSKAGENIVILWSTDTGRELRRLPGHDHAVEKLEFTPDGRSLVSISCEQIIRWDPATGKQLGQIHQSKLAGDLAFSPDRSRLAVMRNEEHQAISLIDPATSKEIASLSGLSHAPQCMAFSPDGATLAAVNPFEPARLWNTSSAGANPQKEESWTLPKESAGVALTFAPGGTMLATASMQGNVTIWDLVHKTQVRRLTGYQGWTNGLAFSPDGKTLVQVGGDSPTIHLWDLADGHDRCPATGHQGPVHVIAFSPDGALLASGGGDRGDGDHGVRLWDAVGGKELKHLPMSAGPIHALAFSPDETLLAGAGEGDPGIHLWHMPDGKECPRLVSAPEGNYRVAALAFSADGKTLAAAGSDRIIRLWDPARHEELLRLSGHDGPVTALAYSPDGTLLVSAGEERTVRFWNPAVAKEVRRLEGFKDAVVSIAFSPDGKQLATGVAGQIKLWDVADGRERRCFADPVPGPDGAPRLLQLAFAADGYTLAAGYSDHRLRLWEIASGKERRCIAGHIGLVSAVAFAPQGRTLASASADTSVLLWDLTSERSKANLSAADLQRLWDDLAGDDARQAAQAIAALAGSSNAVTFLRERLKDQARICDPDRLDRLLGDLDDNCFAVRRHAGNELSRLGSAIEPILRARLNAAPSLEASRRLQLLLRQLDAGQIYPEHLRTIRAREALDLANRERKRPE